MVTEPAPTIPYDEMRRILGLPAPPFDSGGTPRTGWMAATSGIGTPLQVMTHHDIEEAFLSFGALMREMARLVAEPIAEIGNAARSVALTLDSLIPEDQRPHPMHPAIPRPSHRPPMWANNPTRTHRRRNR